MRAIKAIDPAVAEYIRALGELHGAARHRLGVKMLTDRLGIDLDRYDDEFQVVMEGPVTKEWLRKNNMADSVVDNPTG